MGGVGFVGEDMVDLQNLDAEVGVKGCLATATVMPNEF